MEKDILKVRRVGERVKKFLHETVSRKPST